MSFIDEDYFINDITVPNTSRPSVLAGLTSFITKFEKEILIKGLGITLYTAFIAGLAEADPLTKWTDLRDGADFTLDYYGTDVLLHWNGFKNDDSESLIAYYVFWFYMADQSMQTSQMGIVQTLNENATVVSPALKMNNAWNKMVDLYGYFEGYKYSKECFLDNSQYVVFNAKPSLYNFLLTNLTDYSSWVYEPLSTINEFGI